MTDIKGKMTDSISVPTLIAGGTDRDDRGVVRFVNTFDFARVKRFYVLENWRPGFVRAWHGHMREEKWVTVMRGAAAVAVARITENGSLEFTKKYILTDHSPAVLHIPAGYANGSQAFIQGTQVIHFSSVTLADTVGDDLRWPWDTLPGVWEEHPR